MRHIPSRSFTAARQQGAALVVGLLLLLILTLLAISGMNTSSLELIMAGNTQYSQNAFQAAEAGIERSIAANVFNPDPSLPMERQQSPANRAYQFTALTTPQLAGAAQPALPGSSLDSFSTYHFEIASTGSSVRGATARNVQALAVIAPADSTTGPAAGGGTRALE